MGHIEEKLQRGRVQELDFEELNAVDHHHWATDEETTTGRKRMTRVVQFLVKILCTFLHQDLYSGQREAFQSGQLACMAKRHESGWEKFKKLASAPIWVRAFRLFFTYFGYKLLVASFWEYKYSSHSTDIKRLKITLDQAQRRFEALDAIEGAQSVDLWRQRLQMAALHAQLATEMANMENCIETLKQIGAPYYTLEYAIVIGYIYLLCFGYFIYMHTQLIGRLWRPIDFALLRLLLDGAKEQRHRLNWNICSQVNGYIASSENFRRAHLLGSNLFTLDPNPTIVSGLSLIMGVEKLAATLPDHSGDNLVGRQMINLAALHRDTAERVKQLALDGKLQPANRNSRWINRMAIFFLLVFVCVELEGATVVSLVYLIAPIYGLYPGVVIQTGPRDLLFLCETMLFNQIAALAAAFYVAWVATVCLDQIKYVFSLIEMTNEAIRANEIWLGQHGRGRLDLSQETGEQEIDDKTTKLRKTTTALISQQLAKLSKSKGGRDAVKGQPARSSPLAVEFLLKSRFLSSSNRRSSSLSSVTTGKSSGQINNDRRLNIQVVTILLQFRIFVHHWRGVESQLGVGAGICILLTSLLPILSRVFANPLEQDFKWALALTSVVFAIVGDLVFVPICYLHSRCLKLYKKLSNLLAHVVEVSNYQAKIDGRAGAAGGGGGSFQLREPVYDEHTIWILRKELSLPEKMLNRFAPKTLMTEVTYATFLRLHFWCGLLVVSMYTTSFNQPGSSGVLSFF